MPELDPGTTFADHRIEAIAGRGGMGVVYRARHVALDREVALKVIAPEFSRDDEFRRRFQREIRAAASIQHPNVVPTASMTANVISTPGDAALSATIPGPLANGAFTLPEPLRVDIAPAAWSAPVSNAPVANMFKQLVKATDALRTGAYARAVTFTLSTTSP